MRMRPLLLALAALCVAQASGCAVDRAPSGLRKTPLGPGATIKFDLSHRPLPELPLPNDVATFADPSSRTGRRVNVSVVAPTMFERRAREDFATLEGWGTSAPISVSFERAEGAAADKPAIDLADVLARMHGDEHDLSNDPVYVVNLRTGVPMFVDVGNGYYPVTLRDPWRYFPNDEKAGESNLVFETVEEGAGLTQAGYRPELDRDFDGVLDHPNTLTGKPAATPSDVLTWYERETDTLVLRPILPLDEKTEYAVVITDRLRGSDGNPVRSPFEDIHHPQQTSGVARLKDILSNKRATAYFGDVAGTGLDRVAFAWTFTTQPVAEDMRLLRDGLYGKGPFARFASEYPADARVFRAAGLALDHTPTTTDPTPACRERAKTPYVVKLNDTDVKESFKTFFEEAFGLDKGESRAIESALGAVDHVVLGDFKSPFLMGDPRSTDPDTRFGVDFKTGAGDVRADDVTFFLSVPKETAAAKQPFPVAFWGHGVTGRADEVLFYAGDFARQGIALFAYNNPEHGVVLSATERALASGQLTRNCLVPFLDAYTKNRTRDVDGDGVGDSGELWWTAHIFHTRDNVRQGLLDGMQAVRMLRGFDGVRRSTQDFNGDGAPELAGDFDGNGVPDLGGPNVPYFAAGESLGGIMSGAQGGIEPYMIAAAPMSGGGSLAMDVAMRSYGVVESVTGQMLGPIVFAVPATERPDRKKKDQMGTRCADTQRSVRIHVNNGVSNHEMEIACVEPGELADGMSVLVSNVTSGERRCARTGADGRFRVPIPTSAGDRLDVQIYTGVEVFKSYDGCLVREGAPVGRRISRWEQPALEALPLGDESKTCDAAVAASDVEPAGCQQFRDVFFPVGTPLVAPNHGLGLRRQTPELRRLRDLAQAGFDAADPINFAPYYMLRALRDENGAVVAPHALLNINTIGDNFVQVSAGLSFARAAGALPFLPPRALERYPEYADHVTPEAVYDALGRRTPMDFLVDTGVAEGIARLGRSTAGPTCRANYKKDADVCTKSPTIAPYECANALFDPDWLSEGAMLHDQPHAERPLRLARIATVRPTDPGTLAKAWEPRLRGVPFAPDDTAWAATDPVVALLNHYLVPKGAHTWNLGDTCRAWDYATYGNGLMARFFATRGKDVYYLSHPTTHGCLADATCPFITR